MSLARPQLESNTIAYELQSVGALIIEVGLEKPRIDHLGKKTSDPNIAHGADAKRQGIARIDNAIFLHLGNGVCKLLIADIGIVAFDEIIGRAIVAIDIIIPADDRGIDESLNKVWIFIDQISRGLDRGRIGIVTIIGDQKHIRLELA